MRRNVLLLAASAVIATLGIGSYAFFEGARQGSPAAKVTTATASAASDDAPLVTPGIDNEVQVPYLPQWQARIDYLYSLEYATKVAVVGGEQFLDLSFRAELAIARAPSGNEHLVKVQWSKIELEGQPRAERRPEVSAFLRNLADPIIGRYRSDGELVAVHASARIEAPVFGLLSYVLADLQLQAPPDHQVSWRGDELDFVGLYDAEYRRMAGEQVWRSHRRYRKLHEGMVGTVEKLDHTAKFSFGEDGVLTLFDSSASIMNRSDVGGTRGATTLRAKLLASQPGSFAEVPSGFATFPIKPLDAGVARERAVPSQPAAILASGMRTHAGDMSAHFETRAQLAARIKHHPDEIPQVLNAIRGALDAHESARLLATLADAGTLEATRAVADLARDKSANLELRQQAVGQLGIAENPTAESARELSALASDPSLEDDVRRSATLGLGANLRNAPQGAIEEGEREAFQGRLAEQATDASTPADRRAAISALGNTGSADALPALQAGLTSPWPAERASAVFALRHIPTREAEQQILAALLKDPAPTVRSSAAEALASRPTRTEAAATTLMQALGSEQVPSVQRSLLVPVPFYLSNFPELERALAALAERSRDAELKKAIAQALQAAPGRAQEHD